MFSIMSGILQGWQFGKWLRISFWGFQAWTSLEICIEVYQELLFKLEHNASLFVLKLVKPFASKIGWGKLFWKVIGKWLGIWSFLKRRMVYFISKSYLLKKIGVFFVFFSLSTCYYTTESTPWVSNAAGLHCATQLSKPVLNTSNIHYYRFSYKNRNFSNLCSVLFFVYIYWILFLKLL